MALAPGTRLGVYDIAAQIGEGGMGAVYRATDTSLGRQVALKVLPDAVAQDAERLARFEREARTLAALNHPNIATIYAVEKSGGTTALVMELVEGEDLSERIARGALPLDEALPIAKQVAEALEAAHEQGIIHRDLKPANIKVRDDGTVKVLDFGLAKATGRAGQAGGAGGIETVQPALPTRAALTSPTLTSPVGVTGVGIILGTAAYMAPEQAKGRPADARADIWAFGCVLFEMVTGTRPFDGPDTTEMIAAVVRAEPEWARLPATTQPSLRRLLKRCLTKDLRQRLGSIHDARLDLDEVASGDAVSAAATPAHAPGGSRWMPWAIAAVATTAAVVLGALRVTSAPAVPPVPAQAPPAARFELQPPASFQGRNRVEVAMSPDGRFAAMFSVGSLAGTSLVLRDLQTGAIRELPGTVAGFDPAWSPDSRHLAFIMPNRQIARVALDGGSEQVVCACSVSRTLRSLTWVGDWIVFMPDSVGALMKVPAAGGSAVPATALDTAAGERQHLFPVAMEGDGFAFLTQSSGGGPSSRRLAIGTLGTKTHRVADTRLGGSNVAIVGSAVVFARGGALIAQPINRELQLWGQPTTIAPLVITGGNGAARFSASRTGLIAYTSGSSGTTRMTWVDRRGRDIGTVSEPAVYSNPALSPEGNRLAVGLRGANGQRDLWLIDLVRGARSRLTTDPADDLNPAWAPDGSRIYFTSARTGNRTLFTMEPFAGAPAEQIGGDPAFSSNVTYVSPDGQFLLFSGNQAGQPSMYALDLSTRREQPLLGTAFLTNEGQVSPDGHWLLFMSEQSGQPEIYVTSFPTPGRTWQVSTRGGSGAQWTSRGREIVYVEDDRRLMSATFAVKSATQAGTAPSVPPSNAALQIGSPTLLFERELASFISRNRFVVTPDGARFLLVTDADQTASSNNVVVNWPSLLK